MAGSNDRRPGDLQLGRVIGGHEPYTLPYDDRNSHLYVCGQTKVGKSKFLERLIRQDIVDWHHTHDGVLLIDPHGSVYNGLIQWLAEHRITDVPVIPIELGQKKWVTGYNWLRPRLAEPNVIVQNFIDLVAHVWGENGTNATPLFQKWAASTIRTLYEKGFTLAESTFLTDRTDQRLRKFMTRGIKDPLSAADWAFADHLNPKEYDQQIGSSLRRFSRFIATTNIRASLGQVECSLDLRRAIDEGHIILVSLSLQGAQINLDDANLYAAMLLRDLWTTAQERPKPLNRQNAKHFNVYVDEFSRFVTPTMAQQLAEASGYGLCMTMAQQFPRQLLSQGTHGVRLFDEVMENAASQVVFRLKNPENLKPLAEQMFFGTFDPSLERMRMYSTKVLEYQEQVRRSRTQGVAVTEAHTESTASGSGRATGSASGSIHIVGEGESQRLLSDNRLDPTGMLRAWNETFGDTDTNSASQNEFEVTGASDVKGSTHSSSIMENIELIPILGKEMSHIERVPLTDQLFLASQKLSMQENRQCTARLVARRSPVFLETYDVEESEVTSEQTQEYIESLIRIWNWEFFLPFAIAQSRIEERHGKLLASRDQSDTIEEAKTSRRRVEPGTGE